jgi:acyl-CoA synthetase (AMP-forming)/AMP-acid ligase II
LLSLVHALEWRAAVNPGAIALTDQQGAKLSYAGLAAAAERSAAGFAAAGIAPGDVVPILARNQAGWVTAMLGLIRAGALPAAVNWRLAAPEVTALLRLAGPLPITSLPPEDHDPARGRLGTAGRASLGWEVRLGERGEIQVRGAAPMPGYWNDPEATARSLTADGFYRTGDVGTIGADGYLTIVDRLSDLVITGGENVYPAEVEAVLARHPAIADVAVIGIPDELWGETVHAVAVPAPASTAPGFDAVELVGWARERLAGFKCPTGVTVVSELPRNATGKVLRAALREPFWAGHDRLVS